MAHSTIASLESSLGYRCPYGIYRPKQDPDLRAVIDRVIGPRREDRRQAETTRPRTSPRPHREAQQPDIPDTPCVIAP
jgi:hypothetical protein